MPALLDSNVWSTPECALCPNRCAGVHGCSCRDLGASGDCGAGRYGFSRGHRCPPGRRDRNRDLAAAAPGAISAPIQAAVPNTITLSLCPETPSPPQQLSVSLPPAPAKADVVFAFDVTSSMNPCSIRPREMRTASGTTWQS